MERARLSQQDTDYQFTAAVVGRYLHVTGAGRHTADNMRRFLADAYRAATDRGCDSVLLVLRFSGPSLDLGSIYSVVTERSMDGSRLKRIAFVDTNAEHPPERAEFAEMAANKLGVNVRLFRGVAEAERWLFDDST
ncbi:MAG TPA: hypothetical protein VKB34_14175 [Povalibacter sp.]|nr:hypothetical protein [Povalibacter sp.]